MHIRDAARTAMKHAGDSRERFMRSQLRIDATVRQIGNIGEAAKNLSIAARNLAPEIPWKEVAGMRDIVIHEYFGVSPDIVWNTVTKDVPRLLRVAERLLGDGKNQRAA